MSSFRNIVFALCVMVTVPALAVEYTATASVDQRVLYDSNIMLFPDSAEMDARDLQDRYASAYDLTPGLLLGARGPRWEGSLNTRLRFTRLSNGDLDSDDQFLDLNWERAGERMRWSFAGSLDRRSTRSLVADLDDDFILNASRIESRALSPGWSLTLTEKDLLQVGVNWLDTEYAAPRFADYENYGVDVGWRHQFDQQNDLTVTVYRSEFDSSRSPTTDVPFEISTKSETLGLQLGLSRRFNEAFSGSLTIGVRQVDSTSGRVECVEFFLFFCTRQDVVAVKNDSTGFTAQSGFNYAGELWSLNASLGRSLVPNGSIGGLLETDTVNVRFQRQLAPQLSFELSANASQAETLNSTTFYQRDQMTIVPLVRWQFSKRWSLSGSLRYRVRDVERDAVDPLGELERFSFESDGSAIIFQVRYQHPRASVSR